MYYLSHEQIENMGVAPATCVSWVETALRVKEQSLLPPKVSISLDHNVFYNTMPCYLAGPSRFGVKIVSRFPLRSPALLSQILLYDGDNGQPLVLADGDWITAMRTGASAALSIGLLEHAEASVYGFVGLGNTARATLLCLLEQRPKKHFTVRLLKYKDHVEGFIQRFAAYNNLCFEVVESYEALISGADVVVSSVTAADGTMGEDAWFKKGVLVVPIHTRGFQNCDLFFDRVYCDDVDHIRGFKFFDRFKILHEMADVIKQPELGRASEEDRILVYNIGIALLDVYFLHELYKMADIRVLPKMELGLTKNKFWV